VVVGNINMLWSLAISRGTRADPEGPGARQKKKLGTYNQIAIERFYLSINSKLYTVLNM
jgi:hypothetical protein